METWDKLPYSGKEQDWREKEAVVYCMANLWGQGIYKYTDLIM